MYLWEPANGKVHTVYYICYIYTLKLLTLRDHTMYPWEPANGKVYIQYNIIYSHV
jgi:hypothetical protein